VPVVAAAAAAAAEANCKVALALASFEIVRAFGAEIEALMRSGRVSAVFANEDEAREVVALGRLPQEKKANPNRSRDFATYASETTADHALDTFARWSPACVAVVTLGDRGCVAARGDPACETSERVACEAFEEIVARDSTGAGDLFVSGFMYGLLRESPLGECAELGCLAGAAATQSVGAEVSDEGWAWVRDRTPIIQ
jgi:sugar/nucleoside kinase (ribokinase family)